MLMSEADLEVFLLRIALPPVRLGLYMKRLNARRADPAAGGDYRPSRRHA